MIPSGTSLAVPWLRLCISTAEDMGSIPGLGSRISHAMWGSQKEKENYHNDFDLRKEAVVTVYNGMAVGGAGLVA